MALLNSQIRLDTRTVGCATLSVFLVACSPASDISAAPSSASHTGEAPPAAASHSASEHQRPTRISTLGIYRVSPHLSAQQVESIVFDLIGNIRSKADLTEARIEASTGLRLHRLDSRNAAYAKGTTSEGWRFAIGIERFAVDDARLEIATLPKKQGDGSGPLTCTLPFDKFRNKLDAANFRSDSSTGLHGKAPNWRFSKNGQVVHIDLYATEPLDRGGIECIEHISVVIDNAEN